MLTSFPLLTALAMGLTATVGTTPQASPPQIIGTSVLSAGTFLTLDRGDDRTTTFRVANGAHEGCTITLPSSQMPMKSPGHLNLNGQTLMCPGHGASRA